MVNKIDNKLLIQTIEKIKISQKNDSLAKIIVNINKMRVLKN